MPRAITGVAGAAASALRAACDADRAVRIDDHAALAIDPAHLRGAAGLVDAHGVEIGADARERIAAGWRMRPSLASSLIRATSASGSRPEASNSRRSKLDDT